MTRLVPEVPGDVPEPTARMLAACSLALRIMESQRIRTWQEVTTIGYELSPEQRRVIAEHEHLIRLLRGRIYKSKDRAGQPRVNLTACPVCGRWGLISTKSKPKKCNLTRECPGTIITAKEATEDET